MDHVTTLRQVKVNQNVDLKMVLGKNIEIEKVNKEGIRCMAENEKIDKCIKWRSLNWWNVHSTKIYVFPFFSFFLKWIEINVKGLLNCSDGGTEITAAGRLRDDTR